MAFFASMLLPLAVGVVLIVATGATWWGRLQSPWKYIGLSILVLLGVHRAIHFGVLIVSPLFWTSDYFVAATKDPARYWDLLDQSFTIEAVVVSTLIVAIGLPVLRFLRSLLTKV